MPDRSTVNAVTHLGNYQETKVNSAIWPPVPKWNWGVNPYRFYRFDSFSQIEPIVDGGQATHHSNEAGLLTLLTQGYNSNATSFGGYDGYSSSNETIDRIRIEAANRHLSKITQGSINLGVIIGEAPETIRFLTKSVKRIYRAYRSLRGGHIGKGLSILGVLPRGMSQFFDVATDSWLTYSYAVRPILKDCYDASHFLEDRITKVFREHRIESSYNYPFTHRSYIGRPPIPGDKKEWTTNVSLKVSDVSYFKVTAPPTLLTLDALGLNNPLQLAWELVPLSFVADWFIPIGKFLGNLKIPSHLQFVKGYQYVKASSQSNIKGVNAYSVGSWPYSCTVKESLKDRVKRTSAPVPKLIVPALNLNLSQFLSGLSLLYQRR